jgi:hypothetical protein
MKTILNFVRNFIINNIYLKFNKNLYYTKNNKLFLGSFNFFRILILNFLFPGRLFFAFKYNQVFKNYNNCLNFFNKKIFYFKKEYPDFFNEKKILIIKSALKNLYEDGAVLVESYFDAHVIENIKNKYADIILKEKELFKNNAVSTAKYNLHLCKLDNEIKNFIYDPGIILLLESYFLREIYARNYPCIINTHVPESYVDNHSKSDAANSYHVDHRMLAVLYIFLEDVISEGTCLEIVPGTQKNFNLGYLFSNEVLIKKETKKFTGKKGSFHIHLGNTIHRAHLKSGIDRLTLYFEYTLGPNILLDVNKIALTLGKDFNINNLNSKERKFLRGIYPLSFEKGYEIKKDSLIRTTYKGL